MVTEWQGVDKPKPAGGSSGIEDHREKVAKREESGLTSAWGPIPRRRSVMAADKLVGSCTVHSAFSVPCFCSSFYSSKIVDDSYFDIYFAFKNFYLLPQPLRMNPIISSKVPRAFIARRPLNHTYLYLSRSNRSWRTYSTALSDDTLPLKGIRVLDMTRVLAGVGIMQLTFHRLVLTSHAAILYTNPGRPGVCCRCFQCFTPHTILTISGLLQSRRYQGRTPNTRR